MDKESSKGFIEYFLLQRQIELWTQIVKVYSKDPAYAKKDWNTIQKRGMQWIQEGSFSEKARK